MENNDRNITENKKVENEENIKNKKDFLLDIKQSLFQQLTTQSSRKLKNRDSEENTYKNQKYQNYLNCINCEESNSILYDPNINNEEKSQFKTNHKYKINQKNSEINSKNKKTKNKRISIIKNEKNIMAYFSKYQNKKKSFLNDSNEKTNKDNINKINNYNNNSIYILYTQKSDKENENESKDVFDNYEILASHVGLPFCNYHKYNIQLPKQYTCNFKNCSCCGCLMRKKYQNLEDNYRYKNKQDYIYPVNKAENKKAKYGSVLDKFKKNKNRYTLTEESNQLENFALNLLKPNNINLKIKNKNYIIENSVNDNDNDVEKQNGKKNYYTNSNKYGNNYNLDDINRKNKVGIDEKKENYVKSHMYDKNKNDNNNEEVNGYADNNIYSNENYISKKEKEDSFNESSILELPYEGNDDKNLKRYKYLVNKNDNKSKIHFSILYYKRLNKSYNQIYSKDINDNQNNFNKKGLIKNVEFLRE